MVDWQSPEVVARTSVVFSNVAHFTIGAYVFEFLGSLEFEWQVLTGKRTFKAPMLLYFYCKWALLAALAGMLSALNASAPIHCQALYTFNQWAGQTSIGAASTLLMLRTVALFPKNWFIIVPLLLISGVQWAILFHGISTVRARYDPVANGCIVEQVLPVWLDVVYLYTMFTDFTVMILTIIGLYRVPGRSSLWTMIFQQGLIYFMVAFLANLSVVVLLLLNLNPIMNLILAIPGIACSSTVACRCFVSLSTFARADGAETRGNTWTHGLAWFRRGFAQKRGANTDKPGLVSSVHWVHTVQDPDTLENGRRTTASDVPSTTAGLTSRPGDQRQEHSGGSVDLPELKHAHRLSSTMTRSTDMLEVRPSDT